MGDPAAILTIILGDRSVTADATPVRDDAPQIVKDVRAYSTTMARAHRTGTVRTAPPVATAIHNAHDVGEVFNLYPVTALGQVEVVGVHFARHGQSPKGERLGNRESTSQRNLGNQHAHSFRHPTHGHSSYRELSRDDAPGDRAPGAGRSVLFHRRLPCAYHDRQSGDAEGEQPENSTRLSRLRSRSRQGRALPPKRCAPSSRAHLDFVDGHSQGPPRTSALL